MIVIRLALHVSFSQPVKLKNAPFDGTTRGSHLSIYQLQYELHNIYTIR